MDLVRVTADNLDDAVSVQEELFPGESGRANYEEAVYGMSGYRYYLLYEDGECVGVTGLYWYPEDPDSAWLGWFGIREEYRRRHLGTLALKRFEEMAAKQGFRYARLYTGADDNEAAITFYRACGYICEPYMNPQDSAGAEERMLIFSKPLTDEPLVPWNSRSIHLTEQIRKQNRYSGQPDSDAGIREPDPKG
ncbi:MAG: GNAT family N-acetyltransferase [Erysipelotrichaceae bacterium]|nr:GNAT family N-acetyltransferase [Erysipelotrichaceae bacterium]